MQLSIFNPLLSRKAFQAFAQTVLTVRVFEPATKSPRTALPYPLLCWWAQMDSNHRRRLLIKFFKRKILVAFALFSCHLSAIKSSYASSPRPLP